MLLIYPVLKRHRTRDRRPLFVHGSVFGRFEGFFEGHFDLTAGLHDGSENMWHAIDVYAIECSTCTADRSMPTSLRTINADGNSDNDLRSVARPRAVSTARKHASEPLTRAVVSATKSRPMS